MNPKTNLSILPLAVINENKILRNHILKRSGKNISIIPFKQECEATKFISAIVIIANSRIKSTLTKLPPLGNGYENITDLLTYLQNSNLYLKKNEEPTLIHADSSGYKIIQ